MHSRYPFGYRRCIGDVVGNGTSFSVVGTPMIVAAPVFASTLTTETLFG